MILGIVQARMSSVRLPGKVLKHIQGNPSLLLQMDRLLQCKQVNKWLIATSVDPSDDVIALFCASNNFPCYRGSLSDVLDRYHCAASQEEAQGSDVIVRITADCPLSDPDVIDECVNNFLSNGSDYTSNCIEPSFPDGLDVEVFNFFTLDYAAKHAKLPSEREHVTPYMINHPELFKLSSYKRQSDLSCLRWTVDYPADFELVCRIYEALYPLNKHFKMNDILMFLNNNPTLRNINSMFERNEGMKKSLLQDKELTHDSI